MYIVVTIRAKLYSFEISKCSIHMNIYIFRISPRNYSTFMTLVLTSRFEGNMPMSSLLYPASDYI